MIYYLKSIIRENFKAIVEQAKRYLNKILKKMGG